MKTAPRWKRSEIIGLSAVAIAVAMIGVRALLQPQRDRVIAATCQMNLKQLSLAMLQYNRDYDELYPPARNWAEVLQPYQKRNSNLHNCPARGDLKFGYAMHASVAELSMTDIDDSSNTIMYFDSDAGTLNQTDTGTSLPASPRHPKGHGIAFTDGHMRFVPMPDMEHGHLDPAESAKRREERQRQKQERAEQRQKENLLLWKKKVAARKLSPIKKP